ncbi:23S rRNA pseudouridine synthase, partial [Streptococcus sp. GMD4S]
DAKNGQYAETHISRLKQFPNQTTLVRCKLKTGRTHQIRVHLSHHKYPILGDPLYNSRSKVSRLMLHAFRLSFTHPLTLEKLSFTALSDTFETELKQNG